MPRCESQSNLEKHWADVDRQAEEEAGAKIVFRAPREKKVNLNKRK
jgi:hypothetical protein